MKSQSREIYFYNRQIWGDIVKGIAILLVIFGHSIPPNTISYKIIFLFHIPTFFFISGYFTNFEKYKNNFRLYIKNISKRLLLPCLFTYILTLTKPFILLGINSIVYSLWFLICLIWVKILLWIFLKLTQNKKINLLTKILILNIIAQAGASLGQIVKLPFYVDVALVALYVTYIGYIFKEYNLINNKKLFKILFIISLISGYIGFKNFGLDMTNRFYSDYPLISVNISIIISSTIIYIGKFLEKIKIINKFFAYLGINSLCIMIYHTIAYSTYSLTACVSIRLLTSVLIIELLSFIPFIKDVYGVKTLRTFFKK